MFQDSTENLISLKDNHKLQIFQEIVMIKNVLVTVYVKMHNVFAILDGSDEIVSEGIRCWCNASPTVLPMETLMLKVESATAMTIGLAGSAI